MPLRKGKSNRAVSANVKTLREEGYPENQAVAIAMRKAGKTKRKTTKTRKPWSSQIPRRKKSK